MREASEISGVVRERVDPFDLHLDVCELFSCLVEADSCNPWTIAT
jgi:hypothetical protein